MNKGSNKIKLNMRKIGQGVCSKAYDNKNKIFLFINRVNLLF